MTAAGTSLTAVADRLTRAADRIDMVIAVAPDRQQWSQELDTMADEGCASEFIAYLRLVDPAAMAALVDPMQEAADGIRQAITTYGSEEQAWAYAAPDDVTEGLDRVARRLLGEEESGG